MKNATFDALATNSHFSPEKWNEGLQGFGNIQEPGRRGLVLSQISKGIGELWKRYAPAQLPRPPLAVPIKPLEGDFAASEGSLSFSRVNGIIIASRKWLEKMSALQIDALGSIVGYEGQVSLTGMLPDLWLLNGCEEADHALWNIEGKNKDEHTSDTRNQNLAHYDAQPIEFRALERQLEIATSLSMPVVTITILRERIANARRVMQTMS